MKSESFAGYVTAVIVAVLIVLGIDVIADTVEVQECYELREQSKQYEGFYLLGWQVDQCEAHNIKIDAPIERL